jgi:hypothetical protein
MTGKKRSMMAKKQTETMKQTKKEYRYISIPKKRRVEKSTQKTTTRGGGSKCYLCYFIPFTVMLREPLENCWGRGHIYGNGERDGSARAVKRDSDSDVIMFDEHKSKSITLIPFNLRIFVLHHLKTP